MASNDIQPVLISDISKGVKMNKFIFFWRKATNSSSSAHIIEVPILVMWKSKGSIWTSFKSSVGISLFFQAFPWI